MLRIGINGVGRIGRGIFRVNQMKNAFKVVAINDINPDTNNIAYTLNYDTLYGRLEMPLKVDKNLMYDNHNNSIEVYHEHSITDVDWAKHVGPYGTPMTFLSQMLENFGTYWCPKDEGQLYETVQSELEAFNILNIEHVSSFNVVV